MEGEDRSSEHEEVERLTLTDMHPPERGAADEAAGLNCGGRRDYAPSGGEPGLWKATIANAGLAFSADGKERRPAQSAQFGRRLTGARA